MPTNLFNDIDIGAFIQKERHSLEKKISNYEDSKISSMALNIDDEIDTLISSCNLNVPKFKKDQLKRSIVNRPRFSPSQQREVQHEAIVYTLPFEGNPKIFKCAPTDSNGIPIEVFILNPKSLSIELTTTYGEITGNDSAISELDSRLLKKIEIIESILTDLSKNLNGYLHGLRINLKAYVHKLEEKIKEKEAFQIQKKNSESKPNPFK